MEYSRGIRKKTASVKFISFIQILWSFTAEGLSPLEFFSYEMFVLFYWEGSPPRRENLEFLDTALHECVQWLFASQEIVCSNSWKMLHTFFCVTFEFWCRTNSLKIWIVIQNDWLQEQSGSNKPKYIFFPQKPSEVLESYNVTVKFIFKIQYSANSKTLQSRPCPHIYTYIHTNTFQNVFHTCSCHSQWHARIAHCSPQYKFVNKTVCEQQLSFFAIEN